MGSAPLPTVEHVTLSPLSTDTVWWTLGGQLSLTICAKATFALRPDGDMVLSEPLPIYRTELQRFPALSSLAPADVIPQLVEPEVTMVGHALNPVAVSQARVRLAVTRDGDTLVDKVVLVRGDLRPDGAAEPFTTMPLSFERAYGGIGFADNPLGRGASELGVAANVLHPSDPEQVASFAPIPSAFTSRRHRLAGLAPKAMHAPCVDIPDAFDWRYFQSAPSDQRLGAIVGEEWIWLEGVSADRPRLRTRLPFVHAAARAYGAAPGTVPDSIPLRAESLHIDADASLATLVWRGSFPFHASARELLIAVGLSIDDAPIAWPTTPEELALLMSREPSIAPGVYAVERMGDTLVVANRTAPPPATAVDLNATSTLPFEDAADAARPDAPAAPIPGAPWSRSRGRNVVAPVGAARTLAALPDEAELRAELDRQLREAEQQRAAEQEREAAREQEADAASHRRELEAAAFRKEQEEAAREAARREAAELEAQREQRRELRSQIYGGFKR